MHEVLNYACAVKVTKAAGADTYIATAGDTAHKCEVLMVGTGLHSARGPNAAKGSVLLCPVSIVVTPFLRLCL